MLIPAVDQQIQEVAQDHAVDGIIFLDERVSDRSIAPLLETGFPVTGSIPFLRAVGAPVNPLVVK